MRVLVLGAGGAASNGFARALKLAGGYEIVGANCNPDDLLLSECDTNHLIAPASDYDEWRGDLFNVVKRAQPDFVHAQNDGEVEALARFRTTLHTLGAKTLLPDTSVVGLCRDKWASYQAWQAADVPVPETFLAKGTEILYGMTHAKNQEAWLRPRTGAGGQKALRTNNFEVARAWLNHTSGWGEFTVAECLTADTVTVQQLYFRGHLVCSQQRTRRSWANGANTNTGVSGSTGVGETSSHREADRVAGLAVQAVDKKPHGLYGVDMAYSQAGTPCVTEINCGRFFTTAPEFFARAGFNMADIYAWSGAYQHFGWDVDWQKNRQNPLPDGIKWIRGMDSSPVLVKPEDAIDWRTNWAQATHA